MSTKKDARNFIAIPSEKALNKDLAVNAAMSEGHSLALNQFIGKKVKLLFLDEIKCIAVRDQPTKRGIHKKSQNKNEKRQKSQKRYKGQGR